MHPSWFSAMPINPSSHLHHSLGLQSGVRGIDMNFKPHAAAAAREEEGREEGEEGGGGEDQEGEGGAEGAGEDQEGEEEGKARMGGERPWFSAIFEPGTECKRKRNRDEDQRTEDCASKDPWKLDREWLRKLLSRKPLEINTSSDPHLNHQHQDLSTRPLIQLKTAQPEVVSELAPMNYIHTETRMRHGNGDSRANDNTQDAEKMESISGRSRDGNGNGSSPSKIVSDILYITSEDRSPRGGFYQNMVNSAAADLIETRNRNQTEDRDLLQKTRSMVFETSPDHQHIIQRIMGSKHVLESDTKILRGNAKDLDMPWSSRRSRPKKLRLTKEQSALLEESFKAGSTLNLKQKNELAKHLNLQSRQVEVWFQNRRARTKLKQTEVDCEMLKQYCMSLMRENRRLQKEASELRAINIMPKKVSQATIAATAASSTISPLSAHRNAAGILSLSCTKDSSIISGNSIKSPANYIDRLMPAATLAMCAACIERLQQH